MVILDTSIIIDHLRRSAEESKLLKILEQNPDERFGISVISVQELYEGKSTRDAEKENRLLTTLQSLEIFPYDTVTATLAGKIARESNKPIEFADAAIAATAIQIGCPLYTLNEKDFRDIGELELYHRV